MTSLFFRGRADLTYCLMLQKQQEQKKNPYELCQAIGRWRGGREKSRHTAFSSLSNVCSNLSQSFLTDHIFFYKEKWVWVEKNQKLPSSQFLEEWSSYYMGRRRKIGKKDVFPTKHLIYNNNKNLFDHLSTYSFWANFPQYFEVGSVQKSLGQLLTL